MRRFRRFRGRRGGFGRFRRMVQRVTQPIVTKRIILDKEALAADAGTDFSVPTVIGLLASTDGGTNAELNSDGTNIAECNPYSRLVGIKLQLWVVAAAGTFVRWVLYKDEDNEGFITTLADTVFHTSADTPAQRELHRLILAKGMFRVSSSTLGARVNIFVRRKALRRNSLFKENDRLELAIAQDDNNVGSISGFGSLWVAEN